MSADLAIHTYRLTKRFGSKVAVDRVSLDVPRGSVQALLGPKGAGKTTLLRLIMGLIFPESGSIERGGLVPASIGYLPERLFLPPALRVRDYLDTVGRLVGLRGEARRTEVLRLLGQLGLEEAADLRLKACPPDVLRRVGIAQALLGDPSLLLLDEPMAGLDPAGQTLIRALVLSLREAGKTVVLSSHNLGELAPACTHVAVLSRGRLVSNAPVDNLLPPRAEVTILTGPMPAALPSRLRALGAGVLATAGKVRLIGEGVDRKAEVLRVLLEAGVDITNLSEKRATPEEAYLEATE